MSTIKTFVFIFAAGFFWGAWPLLARLTGHNGILGSLILSFSAFLTVAVGMFFQTSQVSLRFYDFLVLVGSGSMMGVGLLFYKPVIENDLIDISITVPIINSLMLLVTVFGGICFFKEIITTQKIVGLLLLVLGIYLLRPIN